MPVPDSARHWMDSLTRHLRPGGSASDLLDRPWWTLFAWGVPVAAMVASGGLSFSWKAAIWPPALAWMGIACLVNAARCGRTHCYLTGPFFGLLAVGAGLHGASVVALGPTGWTWLGLATLVGATVLWYLPERLLAKYLRPSRSGDRQGQASTSPSGTSGRSRG